MTLTPKIEVIANCVHVREVKDGVYHRYVITPVDSYAGKPKAVQDLCKKTFTAQVVDAYKASLEVE